MQPCCHAVYTQVHVCIHVSCSPHAVQVSNLVAMQPTRMRGFASTLSCSLHVSAGLQPPCHAAHTQVRVCTHVALQPTCRCGVATRRSCSPHAVQVCTASVMYENSSYHAQTPLDKHTKSVMQPTRKCGFASASSRSLHASAGLHLHRLASCTRVQVCKPVVMQPTRKCRLAFASSCKLHASACQQLICAK